MEQNCKSYPRKALYTIITLPMIAIYILIVIYLWQSYRIWFFVYLSLFVIVSIGQSYACAYFKCPYVCKFAPCVGGFCLPASRVALLHKGKTITEQQYNIFVTIAFAAFTAIIFLPVYFLSQHSRWTMLGYLIIVLIYAAIFLSSVCTVCGIKHVCPGGKTSTMLRDKFFTRD